ncbi:hypothetical protein [Bradyrhizobium sp. Ash2021]|uniref:hypothetical protein n=1 Tax=Bradyrhizobium sp. Ash2021 TaxID=2954771 RepID=UPI002814A653|nr:hypothetical protein [Bradyrhizobium sp. Ash2021]WMT73689.1 hypothetical protein NL528_38095 [Bradyrhizobium sp. Ash2021]
MDKSPNKEFGKRRPVVARPGPQPPLKRSGHVGLLMMGTLAIGGGAYALMPNENCRPSSPGMAGPAIPQMNAECPPRGSSSGGSGGGGYSSRSSFFSGDSTSSHASSGGSDSGSGGVTRGGFGSFAHSFAAHFSGGG